MSRVACAQAAEAQGGRARRGGGAGYLVVDTPIAALRHRPGDHQHHLDTLQSLAAASSSSPTILHKPSTNRNVTSSAPSPDFRSHAAIDTKWFATPSRCSHSAIACRNTPSPLLRTSRPRLIAVRPDRQSNRGGAASNRILT